MAFAKSIQQLWKEDLASNVSSHGASIDKEHISLCSQLPVCKYVRDQKGVDENPETVSIQSACSDTILADCMHAFQCSDSCYTARVCIRSAVTPQTVIHVPRLHQTLTQSKHRKPRVSAWTVQPQTLGTDSQGRTDAVSVTVPEDSVAELILHCSRTSALTRATRPNPLADPGLRRADRRG